MLRLRMREPGVRQFLRQRDAVGVSGRIGIGHRIGWCHIQFFANRKTYGYLD